MTGLAAAAAVHEVDPNYLMWEGKEEKGEAGSF